VLNVERAVIPLQTYSESQKASQAKFMTLYLNFIFKFKIYRPKTFRIVKLVILEIFLLKSHRKSSQFWVKLIWLSPFSCKLMFLTNVLMGSVQKPIFWRNDFKFLEKKSWYKVVQNFYHPNFYIRIFSGDLEKGLFEFNLT